MDMQKWIMDLPRLKKPLPILSFPSAKLLNVSIYTLTHDAGKQALGIKLTADRVNSAAAVTMMDLSVEAEAFGCEIVTPENEVPTVVGTFISDIDGAHVMNVPKVGTGRTGLCIEAARLAKEYVTDRPVFAGVIGPFSLAGRLMNVENAMMNCLIDPDFVHTALKKSTSFLKDYAVAYKSAGLDGIVMAEPLSGLLSPVLEEEFSAPYVREIIDFVQSDDFAVIYHNCGPNTPLMTESIKNNGAAAYHFGDAVKMPDMLKKMPQDKPVLGNISPSHLFANGTPEKIEKAVDELLTACSGFENFVLSSGCDIPPSSSWENIDAFFSAATKYNNKQRS